MAVIITNMEMPNACYCCEFGKRWDNSSTFCERRPIEPPIEDGCGRPSYCPLKETKEMEESKLDKTIKHEYNIDSQKGKPCWLIEYNCPCRTGACYSGLPGNDCSTYRWFKELIEWNKINDPKRA